MVSYDLDQFVQIQSSGFEYKLPEKVHETINKLIHELGISALTTNPTSTNYENYHERDYKRRLRNDKNNTKFSKNIDTAIWEKQKEFITTKIEKKEGIEKLINDIRICLNKISTKNYETQSNAIFVYIDEIIEKNNEIENLNNMENTTETNTTMTTKKIKLENEELNKISMSIFDIASTNKFYSELYANLYKQLTEKYPIFQSIIIDFIKEKYLENIHKIEYVDQNVDYDKYCQNNKENDKRKAMSVFIINLMKQELIKKQEVLNIILQLENLVLKYIDEENKLNEVEEITENIFLFLINGKEELKNIESFEPVFQNIIKCSQYKVKEHPSISSRALFKYKDIVDAYKK
jgi:hypothetical protein